MNKPSSSIKTTPELIEWGKDGLPEVLGVHPHLPNYVVRMHFHPHGSEKSTVDKEIAIYKAELNRLSNCGVDIPRYMAHSMQTPAGGWNSYIYTQCLMGAEASIDNPEHTERLAKLGEALLKYFSKTPANGNFLDEIDAPMQYTIGRAYGSQGPETLYLHDLDPTFAERDSLFDGAFYTSVSRVEEWIGQLPLSINVDPLLEQAYQLRTAA